MSDENQAERVSLAVAGAVVSVLLSAVVVYAIRHVDGLGPAFAGTTSGAGSSEQSVAAPMTLEFSGNTNQIVLRGAVPDEGARAALLKPARVLWGKDHVVDQLSVVAGAGAPAWQARPVDVLAKLKQLTSFEWRATDDGVSLTGTAASESVRAGISAAALAWLKGRVPPKLEISATHDTAQESAALSDSLLDEHIEFGSGSVALPQAAQARLGDIASLLKDDGRSIVITGHSDNQGTENANRELSLQRAESVRAYLVSQGVPATQLQTAGVGSSEPIADNATAEGRQRNRRIAFSVARK